MKPKPKQGKRRMALKVKPMPALRGEAAKDFIKKAKQVDKGISESEKKEIQGRLWAALNFFSQEAKPSLRSTK